MDAALIDVDGDRRALTVLSNHTGCSVTVEEGSSLGVAVAVEPVQPDPTSDSKPELSPTPETTLTTEPANVSRLYSKLVAWRKRKLAESVGSTDTLSPEQREELIDFLGEHYTAFALEEHECGETNLVEFSIETGDADPR